MEIVDILAIHAHTCMLHILVFFYMLTRVDTNIFAVWCFWNYLARPGNVVSNAIKNSSDTCKCVLWLIYLDQAILSVLW